MNKPRVLIFIVAYSAEPYIRSTLERTLAVLPSLPDIAPSILVIDDSSPDATAAVARETLQHSSYPWEVLCTESNLGYGGNQKLGYTYAIAEKFDAVVLLHGDGQYSPEYIPALLTPLLEGKASGTLGSRMINRADALKGGMPRHKYCGNIGLTWIQNHLLHSNLAEFHTGLRAWKTTALAQLPFTRNDNGFSFDTHILIQMIDKGFTLTEIPISTFYGDETSHVNSVIYSFEVVIATILSRLQKWRWAKRAYFTYPPVPANPDPLWLAQLVRMRAKRAA
jgi:glycosyltransferase involved in cell wall biosynthesis